MDRREFLRLSALGAAAAGQLSLTGCAGDERKTEKAFQGTALNIDGYMKEPARQIPVVASADIVVVGGGPAGIAAAVSAAREGASVIVLEKANCLGGLWTGGLVLPVLAIYGTGGDGKPARTMYGFGKELCDRLVGEGIATCATDYTQGAERVSIDTEGTKYLLDVVLTEAGVQVMYFTQAASVVCSGDRIEAVVAETKSGRLAIRCKAVVDTSGDGDIFAWAGEPFRNIPYTIGLLGRVGNLDRVDKSAPGFRKLDFSRESTPVPGVGMLHMVGEADQDGLDVFNLSRLQQKYRKQLWERVEEIKTYPGYEKVFLMETAPLLGVRVTRSLDAVHIVTLQESMTNTTYKDVIGLGGACDTFEFEGRRITPSVRPVWQIPYSSLTPRTCNNLLVAGRCFGFDRGIAFDAREIATCFVTGQAAGTAAAQALAERASVRDIDVSRLQKRLRENNVVMSL